jgi:hypothetical protein
MLIGNWPLFMQALEHIIKHPEAHDQKVWTSDCGSYRCLAGWIAHFAGYRRDPVGLDINIVSGPGADHVDIEGAALIALELDPEIYGTETNSDEAMWPEMDELSERLFGYTRSMTEILTVVRDLARTDGVTPTPLIIDKMVEAGIITEWGVL